MFLLVYLNSSESCHSAGTLQSQSPTPGRRQNEDSQGQSCTQQLLPCKVPTEESAAPHEVSFKHVCLQAAAKRFKVDKDGTILRRHAGKQHMNEKKTKKRKKFLGTDSPMHETNINNNMGCLPYAKINIPRSKFSPGPQGRQPPNKTLQQASESSSEASSSEASS